MMINPSLPGAISRREIHASRLARIDALIADLCQLLDPDAVPRFQEDLVPVVRAIGAIALRTQGFRTKVLVPCSEYDRVLSISADGQGVSLEIGGPADAVASPQEVDQVLSQDIVPATVAVSPLIAPPGDVSTDGLFVDVVTLPGVTAAALLDLDTMEILACGGESGLFAPGVVEQSCGSIKLYMDVLCALQIDDHIDTILVAGGGDQQLLMPLDLPGRSLVVHAVMRSPRANSASVLRVLRGLGSRLLRGGPCASVIPQQKQSHDGGG